MPIPLSVVREKALIEAMQFLYQHPNNIDGDPIGLLRSLVKEYEAHLPLKSRALVRAVANGDVRTSLPNLDDECMQSVSPIG